MTDTLTSSLISALAGLADNTPLLTGAKKLLNVLGYRSKRTVDIGSVDDFLEYYTLDGKLKDYQRDIFSSWTSIDIVFQFTKGEIDTLSGINDTSNYESGQKSSFLFLAVDLAGSTYTRSYLAESTRAVNSRFAMPVILLFRHGTSLTLAAIHRRISKQEYSRDVLEKVTLVKDIRIDNPHRAHLAILSELAFDRMDKLQIHNFDTLHEEWERILDIKTLNKQFYLELFTWFERAVTETRFPDDEAGDGSPERHIIRLITRLLFIWFLKEKGLVPEKLFDEEYAYSILMNHAPERTDYYRAVLQNMFFVTLNTEIEKRHIVIQSIPGNHDYNEYKYHELLTDSDYFVKCMKEVPFVNGGLFDCLDDYDTSGSLTKLIDVFTEDPTYQSMLYVPSCLFFDENGLFTLFRNYKFTIEESTPLDREVALDPELLGCVFENLLAAYNPETHKTARNATGSYYTPRIVVDYMVREALTEAMSVITKPADGNIATWRNRLKYLFDHSDAMKDADKLFDDCDKCSIVSGIAKIRVLDPAVGSGAFPMGILQVLTLALRRIDPENILWRELQKERAKARFGEAFETPDKMSRDEALREISDTFEKYKQSDYGRKLYLIQNCIYGVDIQPIACQIAKLRFFISLIIEQKPDHDIPNHGIKPLPNLETRFVAADSLLDLKPESTEVLLEDDLVLMQKDITAVRERYFLANSRLKKIAYMDEEKRLRDKLHHMLIDKRQKWMTAQQRDIAIKAAMLPNIETRKMYQDIEFKKLSIRQSRFDMAIADTHKISEWDPYDQNAHASWFNAEYMYGVTDGFDVVVGNPPYIQLQKEGGRLSKRYYNAGYKTFEKSGDIYQLFYERGYGMLKPQTGVLAYITSNSWLKAKYGKKLRNWLLQNHKSLQLIEMGENVFENAIVDTAVLISRHGQGGSETLCAIDIEGRSDEQFPSPKQKWVTPYTEIDRPWMILSQTEQDVMKKMECIGKPLKEWDNSIYRGILTGYNDAFIVNQEIRNKLVAADPKSAEILKPILRGRDIARYRANWDDVWLISTFSPLDLDINVYPAIKQHLLSFGKARLDQDGRRLPTGGKSRKKTANKWFELQDTCAYHAEFLKDKLFWMHLTKYGRFALAEADIICNQKCFIITGMNLKYLCAVLNSKLVTWFVMHTAVTTGKGLPQWDKFIVESIPIVQPDQSATDHIIGILRLLLISIEAGDTSEVKRLQQTIDDHIFALYRLTEDEICEVSNTVRHSWPFQ